MSETNHNTVPATKKAFRNFAAGYAIVVPMVSLVCLLLSAETNRWLFVPPWLAALIFSISFVIGLLLSIFGRTLAVGIRALVFVSMLVSAVLNGFAFLVSLLDSGQSCLGW